MTLIIKLKKDVSNEAIETFKQAIEAKGFTLKDIGSEETTMFGVLGDTKTLDVRDVLAYEIVSDAVRIQSPFKEASRSFHKENTVITLKNGATFGNDESVMIAGPCSIESHTQLDTIAAYLSTQGVKVLRGGAFKPRTSPYSFQGLGLEGLKMLYNTGQKYNMAVISEIMNKEDLDTFNTYTDIIQVGARNMANFDLLKALGKAKKPIMLKRGLSATIEEWLMSAEYIMAHGNHEVILAERGIRTFETYTRNTLDISAVLAVKELSHLPVIIDPSHAAGKYSMIEKLSLAALAVGADGLMVEVHNDPENALSDGAQSLKFDRFSDMMQNLKTLSHAIKRPLQ